MMKGNLPVGRALGDVCVYLCVCVSVCVYLCMCVSVCVYLCVCIGVDSIPNLKDELAPNMEVCARSLLPYCHFHLEDSDYLSSHRRSLELRGPHGATPREPLHPSTRTIQFTSVGLGPHVTR